MLAPSVDRTVRRRQNVNTRSQRNITHRSGRKFPVHADIKKQNLNAIHGKITVCQLCRKTRLGSQTRLVFFTNILISMTHCPMQRHLRFRGRCQRFSRRQNHNLNYNNRCYSGLSRTVRPIRLVHYASTNNITF